MSTEITPKDLDLGGYMENEVEFYINKDGSFSIVTSGEYGVYLYPQQVEHLRIALQELDEVQP